MAPTSGPSLPRPTRSSAAPAAPEPSAPLLLGHFRIINTIDTGGFGIVHVCWDVRLQRRVAIKCIPISQDLPGDSTVEEALSEARKSSLLEHPNIVRLYEFEADDSYAYLVMEYVDGVTLGELLSRVEGGVLVYDEVAHLLQSLAEALEYAHENGVLHLDIKPANVMIDRSGTVKLGDFGMSTFTSAARWEGARGGTVGYMPPEQIDGDFVDERADVFSLGALCYEALTGVAPFLAPTAEKSRALIEKGAEPLSAKEPELAGPVELAFLSAMDPSPANRMASPLELAGEVIPSLGDPAAGKASIASLLVQEEDGQTPFDEAPWRALDPPGRRVPWVAAAACRAANGLAAGVLALRLAPSLGLGSLAAPLILFVAAGGVAAAWPAAGAAAGSGLLALALLMGGVDPASVLCAAAVVALAALWAGRAAPEAPLSCAPLLSASALGSAAFTPGLAAYALTPLKAGATAALGAFLALVATGSGLVPGLLAAPPAWDAEPWGFLNLLSNPGNWALVLAAGVSAALGSKISDRRAPWAAQLGQAASFVLLECGLALKAGLENGGIWALPEGAPTAVALGSYVLMIVIVVLFGPPESRWEGDRS